MTAHEPQRVLVVDDDAVSRELLQMLLAREGYSVETAESGEAAFEDLRRRKTALPDAVLADVQMPGLRGARLATELREVCGPEICLVAISASDAAGEMLAGFDGFLRKPFAMEALADILAGKDTGCEEESSVFAKALDDTVCGQLAASMSRQRLVEFYALCLNDTRRRLEEMREAANHGDDATWRKQAHVIKGSCGMVGASELKDLAGSLESGGLDQTDATVALAELHTACVRLEGMLVERNLLPATTASPR